MNSSDKKLISTHTILFAVGALIIIGLLLVAMVMLKSPAPSNQPAADQATDQGPEIIESDEVPANQDEDAPEVVNIAEGIFFSGTVSSVNGTTLIFQDDLIGETTLVLDSAEGIQVGSYIAGSCDTLQACTRSDITVKNAEEVN